jgi:serine protein kinase
MSNRSDETERHGDFVKSLVAFTQQHRAANWSGTFADFIEQVLRPNPRLVTRSSHQYIWDMIRWQGIDESASDNTPKRYKLFSDDLFGIDEELERLADYFRASSAGSEVGRTPAASPWPAGRRQVQHRHPAQARSRGIQQHRRGARCTRSPAARCTNRRSTSCRTPCARSSAKPTASRSTASSARCARALEHGRSNLNAAGSEERKTEGIAGDFMKMGVERIFISEASRMGIGTYAPHDPTTADIADLVGSVDLSKVAEYGDEGDPRAMVVVRRGIRGEPRHAGNDRDPEGEARVPVLAAHANPGERTSRCRASR